MATSTVSSGGVSTQGNRTYLFGTSSGIDTSALVEAAYNQRVAEADKIDVKIDTNTKKVDAYTTLQTLAQAVQDSMKNLRTTYSSLGNANYVFNSRSGTLSTSSSTDPTKLLGVSIDAGTALGSYEIEVVQKAKAHRIGSDPAASSTTALGATGSFNIGLASGSTATINVTSGMSMTDIATAINQSTSTSGVTASVLKISDNSYQLVLSGNTTAKAIQISGVTGTDVLQNLGVTNGGAIKNELQAADQAILKLDGIQITRDSNEITDLISGVNLSIKNAEPGTTIDLEVTTDNSTIKDAILSFTEAYNNLRDFVTINQTVSSSGTVSDDSILFGDTILKMMNDAVQPLISASYGNGGGALSTLRELGITLTDGNKFEVDETVLDAAIISNFDQVKNIFSTQMTSSTPNLALLGNTSKLKSLNVNFSIAVDSSGAVTGVTANGVGNMFDISGNSIKGKAGTIYEGLSFAYIGTTNSSITFSMTQGLGDLLANTLDNFTNTATGTIAQQKLDLGDENTTMAERADRVRERADDFRTKLIDKYAGYEAAIARSKSIIAQLKAILGTSDD